MDLEPLVTKLIGDSSSLVAAFDTASAEATAAASRVGEHATQIEGFATGIRGFAEQVSTSVGGMASALGLGEGATESLQTALGPLTSGAELMAGQFDVAAGAVRGLQARASAFIEVGSNLKSNLLAGADAARGYWRQLGELKTSLMASSSAALALKASVVALVAVKTADWATGWSRAQEELNRELARTVQLNALVNKDFEAQTASIIEQAQALEGSDKESFLVRQLEKAQREFEGVEANAKRAGQAVLDAANVAESGSFDPAAIKAAQVEYEGVAKQLENARDRVKQINDELAHVPTAEGFRGPDEKTLNDLARYESELKRTVATFGMTADAVKLYEFAQRGATEEQLASLRAIQEQVEAMEAQAKAAKEEEQLLTRLEQHFEDERRAAEEAATAQEKLNDSLREFESVAAGSAEAAARVEAFREGIAGRRGTATATPAATQTPAVAAGGLAGGGVLQVLKDIAANTKATAEKPTVEVEELDLE